MPYDPGKWLTCWLGPSFENPSLLQVVAPVDVERVALDEAAEAGALERPRDAVDVLVRAEEQRLQFFVGELDERGARRQLAAQLGERRVVEPHGGRPICEERRQQVRRRRRGRRFPPVRVRSSATTSSSSDSSRLASAASSSLSSSSSSWSRKRRRKLREGEPCKAEEEPAGLALELAGIEPCNEEDEPAGLPLEAAGIAASPAFERNSLSR